LIGGVAFVAYFTTRTPIDAFIFAHTVAMGVIVVVGTAIQSVYQLLAIGFTCEI
jgi:hypothetical protein